MKFRTFRRLPKGLCFAALLFVAAPTVALAQSDPAAVQTEPALITSEAGPVETETAPLAAIQTQPAGASAPAGQPPRTFRAYWHVFIAFAVTWLLLFGYTVTIGHRWARLERELQSLR
jgi:CcmD family protein